MRQVEGWHIGETNRYENAVANCGKLQCREPSSHSVDGVDVYEKEDCADDAGGAVVVV